MFKNFCIKQLSATTGCSLENLPKAMADRNRWRERFKWTIINDDEDKQILRNKMLTHMKMLFYCTHYNTTLIHIRKNLLKINFGIFSELQDVKIFSKVMSIKIFILETSFSDFFFLLEKSAFV